MPAKESDAASRALGKRIRQFRDQREWDQERLAHELRTHHGWETAERTLIARVENGRRVMRPGDLRTFEAALGLPTGALDPDEDPFAWSELDEWEARVRLDNATERLRDAAYGFGEVFAAYSDGDEAALKRAARKITNEALTGGFYREVERQNG